MPPIRINSRGDRRYTKEQVLWLIGQRQGDQIQPSVNKKLYEVKETSDEPEEINVEKETETPVQTSKHSF